jgi:hypothetical protein
MNGLSKIAKKNLERIEDKTGHKEHEVEEERSFPDVPRVDEMEGETEERRWKEIKKKSTT